MDGFKRPKRTAPTPPTRRVTAVPAISQRPQPALESEQQPATALSEEPLPRDAAPVARTYSRLRQRGWFFWIGGLIVAALFILGTGGIWYQQQLQPVDPADDSKVRFEVKEGTSFARVSSQLSERGLIRSQFAFDLYARLNDKHNIQASTCNLKKSESTAEILDHLTKGCHDFVSVTFYPGATIEKPLYKSPSATIDQEKMYIKGVLLSAGYSQADIEAALKKSYGGSLFADKPPGTSLEGYVFGETYYVDKSATAAEVLQETFTQMESVVERNDLVSKFKAQGLTLYQGITMASIVQRELNCEGKPTEERKNRCYGYQQSIAQVFLKRYKEGISLGSDVTFIYAADKMGVTPTVDLESPYNTRNRVGLPPGPIASPGELALQAVANPSNTDYLFFIAGDDGLIYFANDVAGHEANIKNHCQVLCSEL